MEARSANTASEQIDGWERQDNCWALSQKGNDGLEGFLDPVAPRYNCFFPTWRLPKEQSCACEQ
jgi:hypothetical protein